MPIQLIDGSGDPELETWRGELLMAAAQSLSPDGATLDEYDVHRILEREKPEFLRVWGPVPKFNKQVEGLIDAAA
jgi:hypothetical protein